MDDARPWAVGHASAGHEGQAAISAVNTSDLIETGLHHPSSTPAEPPAPAAIPL